MMLLELLFANFINLSLSKSVCFDPCSLEVTLRVQRDESNRRVLLELESYDSGYLRKSELDYGPRSAITTKIRYANVPAGVYVVRAILFKYDGKDWTGWSDFKEFKVIGQFEDTKYKRPKKPRKPSR